MNFGRPIPFSVMPVTESVQRWQTPGGAGSSIKVKRGLAILRSFIGSLKLSVHDVSIGLDIEPEKGAADSGDLEIDLPNLLAAVGEAAEDRKSAVAIFIDEVQYFNQKELGPIMSMHKIQQLRLLGAGLPFPGCRRIEVLRRTDFQLSGHRPIASDAAKASDPARLGFEASMRFFA